MFCLHVYSTGKFYIVNVALQQRIRQRCRRQLGYDVELPPLPPEATEDGPVSVVVILSYRIILSLCLPNRKKEVARKK